jgi:hypothetical protein
MRDELASILAVLADLQHCEDIDSGKRKWEKD